MTKWGVEGLTGSLAAELPPALAAVAVNRRWKELAAKLEPEDPLKFRDSKKYRDRISQAQKNTGEKDALVSMTGTLYGRPIVACAFEFAFMGGSMGSVVGERFAIRNSGVNAVVEGVGDLGGGDHRGQGGRPAGRGAGAQRLLAGFSGKRQVFRLRDRQRDLVLRVRASNGQGDQPENGDGAEGDAAQTGADHAKTGDERFPVLYLLHGGGGGYFDWTKNTDVESHTAAADIIVAMPDSMSANLDVWLEGGGPNGDGGLPLLFPPEHYQTVMPHIRAGAASAGRSLDEIDVAVRAAREPGSKLVVASRAVHGPSG